MRSDRNTVRLRIFRHNFGYVETRYIASLQDLNANRFVLSEPYWERSHYAEVPPNPCRDVKFHVSTFFFTRGLKNIATFVGNIATFVGNVVTFVGNIATFVGNIATFVGNVVTFVGNVATFVGNVAPFIKNITTFVANVATFFMNETTFVTNVKAMVQSRRYAIANK